LGLGLVLALLGLLMISSAVLADSGDCSADLSNNGPVCAANSCCSTERMIGTVNIATTGFYRVETTVNYNSGDEQKNESFYLVIENSDGSSQYAVDGNAGNYYVVEDNGGPAAIVNKFAGTFYFDAGVNKIYFHHYAGIVDQYPQFLNDTMGSCESVYLKAIYLTLIPPEIKPVISLDKIGPEYAVPGQEISYTLNWSVKDNSVTNLVLTDPIPAKTVFVSASDSGIYDALTNNVVWNLGSKNSGDSGSVTLTVRVDVYTYDTDFIVNTASLDSDETEAVEDTVATEMDAHCVLTINKVDDIDPVQPGDQITYTIEYQNTGDGICVGTGVMLAEYFDQATSFVSSAPEMPHYSSDDLPYDPMPGELGEPDALWQWTELAPDGPHFMTVVMDVSDQAVDGQTLTNKVCIWAENAGSDGGEDTICTTETTTVEIPEEPYFNLSIDKLANDTVILGNQIAYTINWSVTGNMTTPSDVIITDTLPVNANFISAKANTTDVGSYDALTGKFTYNLGIIDATDALANNGSFLLTVEPKLTVQGGDLVSNTVNINSDQENDSATKDVTVTDYNVLIEKSAPANANPGDEITYTLNWQVTGNMTTLAEVMVSDTLPLEVDFVSAKAGTTNVGSYDLATKTFSYNLGILSETDTRSGSITMVVTVKADTLVGNVINNTSKIDAGTGKHDDDQATTTVVATPYFNLSIDKSGPSEVKVGNNIIYGINWSVAGNIAADGVMVIDSLPSNVSFVSANNGGIYNSADGTVVWQLGNVQPGASGSFELIVSTSGLKDGDQVINNVIIKSGSVSAADQVTTNVTEVHISVCTSNCGGGGGFTPDPRVKLEYNYPLTKQMGSQHVETITVTNTGNVILTNGVVSVDFPEEYIKFISSGTMPYVYDATTGKVTWTLASAIGVGANETINVTIEALKGKDNVVTVVAFDSTEADSTTSGEEDILGGEPVPSVQIKYSHPVEKTENNQYAEKIELINTGQADLTNGKLAVDLPEDYVRFVSADIGGYILDGARQTIEWPAINLAVGGSYTVNMIIEVVLSGEITPQFVYAAVPTEVVYDSDQADGAQTGNENIACSASCPTTPPVVRGKVTPPVVAPAATTSNEVAEVCPRADSCTGCGWWVWLIIVLLHALLLFIYWFYASKEEIKENENGEYYIIKGNMNWFLPVILILVIVFLLLVFLCSLQPWWALLMILAAYFLSLVFYSAMLKRAGMKYSPFLPIIVTIAVLVAYLLCASWPWWVWVLILVFYILTLASYYLVIVKMDVKNRNYWWLVPLFMTALTGALLMVMRLCQCNEVIR